MNPKSKESTISPVSDETDMKKNGPEPKYAMEKLKESSRRIFGVSECTFSGATAKMTGDCTIGEVNEAIQKWTKKEVR